MESLISEIAEVVGSLSLHSKQQRKPKSELIERLLNVISGLTKYSDSKDTELDLQRIKETEAIRLLEKFKNIARSQKGVIDQMSEERDALKKQQVLKSTTESKGVNTTMLYSDFELQTKRVEHDAAMIASLQEQIQLKEEENVRLKAKLKKADRMNKKYKTMVDRSNEIMKAQESLMNGLDSLRSGGSIGSSDHVGGVYRLSGPTSPYMLDPASIEFDTMEGNENDRGEEVVLIHSGNHPPLGVGQIASSNIENQKNNDNSNKDSMSFIQVSGRDWKAAPPLPRHHVSTSPISHDHDDDRRQETLSPEARTRYPLMTTSSTHSTYKNSRYSAREHEDRVRLSDDGYEAMVATDVPEDASSSTSTIENDNDSSATDVLHADIVSTTASDARAGADEHEDDNVNRADVLELSRNSSVTQSSEVDKSIDRPELGNLFEDLEDVVGLDDSFSLIQRFYNPA